MSAFIGSPRLYGRVYAGMSSPAHDTSLAIRKMAAAASEWRDIEDGDDTRPAIMRGLYALNVRAVNDRYGKATSEEMPAPYERALHEAEIGAHDYLKALHCLLYQMSEGEMPAHPLYKALESTMHAVANLIVTRSPQYDAAAWDD